MCTAVSLGNDKMKKLVKILKQVKMIKLVIMRLRSVPGFRRTNSNRLIRNFGQH